MDFTYEGLDFVLQIEYDYDNEKIKSSFELLEAVEHELTEIAQDRHDQACDHAYESARDERG